MRLAGDHRVLCGVYMAKNKEKTTQTDHAKNVMLFLLVSEIVRTEDDDYSTMDRWI